MLESGCAVAYFGECLIVQRSYQHQLEFNLAGPVLGGGHGEFGVAHAVTHCAVVSLSTGVEVGSQRRQLEARVERLYGPCGLGPGEVGLGEHVGGRVLLTLLKLPCTNEPVNAVVLNRHRFKQLVCGGVCGEPQSNLRVVHHGDHRVGDVGERTGEREVVQVR